MAAHCVFHTLSPSPPPWALFEQGFAEQKNLSPAGTSQIWLLCLRKQCPSIKVTLHSSELGELVINNTKNPSQQGPRVKFLITKNSYHKLLLLCKLKSVEKEPPQGGWSLFSGEQFSLSGNRGKVFRSPIKEVAALWCLRDLILLENWAWSYWWSSILQKNCGSGA